MLTITHLTKHFGSLTAVDDLNLQIKPGEIFGFLGQNGAGKTTTIKLIAGLLHPDSGNILINGHNVHTHPVEAKQHLAYIPDEPYLYEKMTGFECLQLIGRLYHLPEQETKTRIAELLEIFQVQPYANLYTENYSHGTRQKFVFASALLSRPQLLLIDEPLVGLDPQNAFLVKNILRQIANQNQVAIFLSTHTLSLAEEICDRIGIIAQGKLLVCDILLNLRQKAKAVNQSLENLFLEQTGQLQTININW